MTVILIALVIVLATGLFIAVKRLFQYDEVLSTVVEILYEYDADLNKIINADLDGMLVDDHPEVKSFIERNKKAGRDIRQIYSDILMYYPPRKQKNKDLPRPDVE